MASRALANDALRRPCLKVPLTLTETINIFNNPMNNIPAISTASSPATNDPQRAYPLTRAPIYSALVN